MAMHTPGVFGIAVPDDVPSRLQFWSFAMLPAFVGGSIAASLLGLWFMHLLGVPEGQLLTTAGFFGWCAGAIVVAVMLTAPVVGMRFAYRAQSLRPATSNLVALSANAAAFMYVAATTVFSVFLSTH
jgi:hypothetical protein